MPHTLHESKNGRSVAETFDRKCLLPESTRSWAQNFANLYNLFIRIGSAVEGNFSCAITLLLRQEQHKGTQLIFRLANTETTRSRMIGAQPALRIRTRGEGAGGFTYIPGYRCGHCS